MRMLNFKIKEKEHWSSIKTMLLYLEYIDGSWMPDVSIDMKLAQRLRDL